jgi:hypothetical protein
VTARAVRDDDGNTFEIEKVDGYVCVTFFTPQHKTVPEPCSRLKPDQAVWLARELTAMANARDKVKR